MFLNFWLKKNFDFKNWLKIKITPKVNLIEERLKAIEGNSSVKGMDAIELSFVPDVVIPHKFKMHNFVKYDKSSCPRDHMTMFCQKMSGIRGMISWSYIAFNKA